MSATILMSVQANGGRITRYGDFTVVFMQACSFITTPMEYMQAQNWARGRVTTGNAVRDRTAFVDRLVTVIGRSGSAIATRGSRPLLQTIVKSMKANAMLMEEWSIPHNLFESMEMKKKPAPPGA